MTLSRVSRSARRVFATILVAAVGVLAAGSFAQAEVTETGHTVTTNFVMNPCDPGDGLIVITTDTRWETRLQPDGSQISHFLNHSEGVSANGTIYIANRQATTVTAAGSTTAQVEVEIRRISAGPGPNALITVTGTIPGPLTTTVRCVG